MSTQVPQTYLQLLESNLTPDMCLSAAIVGPYCEIFAAIGNGAYDKPNKTDMLSTSDVQKVYAFLKNYKTTSSRFVLKDQGPGYEAKIIAEPQNYPTQCINLSGQWFTVYAGDKDTVCLLKSDTTPSSQRYGITASRVYNDADPINFGCLVYGVFDRSKGHKAEDITAKIESCKAAMESPPIQQ